MLHCSVAREKCKIMIEYHFYYHDTLQRSFQLLRRDDLLLYMIVLQYFSLLYMIITNYGDEGTHDSRANNNKLAIYHHHYDNNDLSISIYLLALFSLLITIISNIRISTQQRMIVIQYVEDTGSIVRQYSYYSLQQLLATKVIVWIQ